MSNVINFAIKKCKEKYNELEDAMHLTNHLVVSAILLKDGEIYLGVNIPHSGVVCAEMVALGSVLLSNKIKKAQYVIALTKDTNGEFILSNICGNCRQNILYVCPQIEVVVGTIEHYSTIGIPELLPFPYYRKKR